MNIRPAELKDKEEILKTIGLLYINMPDFVWSTEPFIEKQIKNAEYFLLEFENKIVGIISLKKKKDQIHIETLAVIKEFQKKGFGSKLIEFAKQFAKENGFKVLQAYSFVEYQAEKFYKKLGFKKLDYFGYYKNHQYHCFEICL